MSYGYVRLPWGRNGKKAGCYTGKIKIGPGQWQQVTLFSDKIASERKLRDLQAEADRRAAGVSTEKLERLLLPIDDLLTVYIESLRVSQLDADHIRISEWMTRELIRRGKWKRFSDITVGSMHNILQALNDAGKTASYQNKFIKRAKAFVAWALPKGFDNPLEGLRQIREKDAMRTRERRAASFPELQRLFELDIPLDRKICYALGAYNGFRRSDIKRDERNRLRWGRIVEYFGIPCLGLKQKMGGDDRKDAIPLHPYVIELLNRKGRGQPLDPVVSAVPDVRTLEKDLTRAGIPFTDEFGCRLDFHGLRHTFVTNLDRTGTSRATKKKLMRHANEDITDGYSHAELVEMRQALDRLPSPDQIRAGMATEQKGLATGAPGQPTASVSCTCDTSHHQLHQGATIQQHSMSSIILSLGATTEIVDAGQPAPNCYSTLQDSELQADTSASEMQHIVNKELRPSTQVD